jgi:ribosome-associated protein
MKNMSERKQKTPDSAALASKSQRRRDALETRALAARLIALGPADLARLPLEPELQRAIAEAAAIRSHGARKRQLQFVAKLLRKTDAEPIDTALQALGSEARQLTARHHRCESWRDRLLEDGDTALGALLDRRHDVDAQTIRQLVRNARQESARGKPPAAARRLFRALRELDEVAPLPPPDADASRS